MIKYNVSEKLSTSRPAVRGALDWEYQMIGDARPAIQGPLQYIGTLYDMRVTQKRLPAGRQDAMFN